LEGGGQHPEPALGLGRGDDRLGAGARRQKRRRGQSERKRDQLAMCHGCPPETGSITLGHSADYSHKRNAASQTKRADQVPTTRTARFSAMLTVCRRATYRSTSSHTGGPSVPWLTLAQPATVYSLAGSIGARLLRWVIALMRLPTGWPTSIV